MSSMRAALAILLCAAAVGQAGTVPRKSPPFSILRPGPGKEALPVESFRGKVVVLTFISTTCPHCQQLTQELAPLSKEYAARGVQFLECAFDDGAQFAVPGFIQQFQPPFPVGYADRAAVAVYLQRSVIDPSPLWVPHMVFLDRAGVIQADIAGDDQDFMGAVVANTKAMVDSLLAGGAPARKAPGATKKSAATKK
jgi:thiol-disulfide isomerase/thioredoxin